MTTSLSANLPQVLVFAANEITSDFSTGITVANLFRRWPEDRLAQVCLIPSEKGSNPLTPRTAVLRGQGGLLDVPVRWGLRQLRALRKTVSLDRSSGALGLAVMDEATGQKISIHDSLASILELAPVRIDPVTANFVRQVRPDVIYSPLSGIRMMRLAGRLHELTGAPVVPHFLDDWPTTLYDNGNGRARREMLRLLEQTLRDAPAVAVISDAMAAEYCDRYAVSSTPLMNCFDEIGSPKGVEPGAGPVRFVYVGGLHLGRAVQVREIAKLLDAKRGATLQVHAPQEDLDRHREMFRPFNSLAYGPSLPAEAVADVLAEADVLIHVESFDQTTARYTRLSMSTKIPQYLAAARPVLAVGPSSLASIQHLRASGAALVVDETLDPSLSSSIRRLSGDPGLRAQLSVAGVAFAAEHHSGYLVRTRLEKLLQEAIR